MLRISSCLPLGVSVALAAAPAGPTLPPIKGVARTSAQPIWRANGVKALLGDIPGAVVAVEGSLPDLMPRDAVRGTFFHQRYNVRFQGRRLWTEPVAEWLDPLVVMAGPNVVHRSYNVVGVSLGR